MSLISIKTEGDYEITKYSSGGTVRARLNNEIVAEYTCFWTQDDSVHPDTQEQVDFINKKLNINITL